MRSRFTIVSLISVAAGFTASVIGFYAAAGSIKYIYEFAASKHTVEAMLILTETILDLNFAIFACIAIFLVEGTNKTARLLLGSGLVVRILLLVTSLVVCWNEGWYWILEPDSHPAVVSMMILSIIQIISMSIAFLWVFPQEQ